MSSSLSGTSEAFLRSSSGKTPPPAPSSIYAKRARDIVTDDRMGSAARYRPPALRTINSGDSSSGSADTPTSSTIDSLPPPTNFPPGFRRARAGTLPSNVQLAAAQRFGSAVPQNGQSANDFNPDSYNRNTTTLDLRQQHPPTPPSSGLPPAAPQRPAIKHAASVVSTSGAVVTERNSRLRSGSLTLPASGMGNGPFGASVFASNWLAGSRGSNFAAVDEVRSATSDSVHDEFDVHTLDYLGLDEGGRPLANSASINELRAQAQAALSGGMPTAARLRATTVSNPYRLVGGMQGSAGMMGEDDDLMMDDYNDISSLHASRMDSYDASGAGILGYRDNNSLLGAGSMGRARANTMGNLDDHARMTMRRGYDIDQEYYEGDITSPNQSGYGGQSVPGSILKDSKSGYRSGNSSNPGTVRFPASVEAPSVRGVNFNLPAATSRTESPKAEPPAQVQTPSRSLWIGNLDSTFSSEDLIRVFAPYGAIESLRLLPEKECGFVNFVDQTDAIRAKDDVLNRLGGIIGMSNGQAVRVGFGKPDSAPVAPAKGTAVVTAQGIATPGGATHLKSPGAPASPGGLEQVQSTPTRALWIGSIPSTTTPAAILSVFSPFGPIESARVLTHKNCGFINFERLDDAVRARKALNGRDVLGSDVGAIRIGFARVPTKSGNAELGTPEELTSSAVQGIGDLSVGATIHALRGIKGASTVSADQQVLSGNVENYRSNLLLSMVTSGAAEPYHDANRNLVNLVTEQQMVMKALSSNSPESDADVKALADFRPPTMYYTTIPLVNERNQSKRWDATKLRDLRKRLDSGSMTVEEVDDIAREFMDGEIVELASDWLGNTVVQKLFEKCSPEPRYAMLERISPSLAMIGIHKNGTWAAQKIIECVQTPEEIALVTQHLRAYTPPLLLDQYGNYVVQCCLRFGPPDNDFVFDAMVDRLWEIAQGRFGARSIRACLESNHITLSQQRRLATAVILNSIPLATNPNGALLLTWLLDSSSFPCRYTLLAPRFTPHLSHLCTHKLASLTVLRLVNQKVEPLASSQVVEGLFLSPNDQVLTDVLGDQVNGVAVVHKVLTSPFLSPQQRDACVEATKRVLIELKVIATQAYRRLIEEVGLQVPMYQTPYGQGTGQPSYSKSKSSSNYSVGSPAELAPMMNNLQLQAIAANQGSYPTSNAQYHNSPNYGQHSLDRGGRGRGMAAGTFSPNPDPFNPFGVRSPEMSPIPMPRGDHHPDMHAMPAPPPHSVHFPSQSSNHPQAGMVGLNQQQGYAMPAVLPPHLYQAYYQMYQQQNPQNVGAYQ